MRVVSRPGDGGGPDGLLDTGHIRRRQFDRGRGILTRADADSRPQQYLIDEMRQRVAREPARWDLIFQLAESGSPTHDQLLAWPESRAILNAGTLTVLAEHVDQQVVEQMVFDPANVPPGVECSDDPLLAFPSAVYSASYVARTRETTCAAIAIGTSGSGCVGQARTRP
jgi:catalase